MKTLIIIALVIVALGVGLYFHFKSEEKCMEGY